MKVNMPLKSSLTALKTAYQSRDIPFCFRDVFNLDLCTSQTVEEKRVTHKMLLWQSHRGGTNKVQSSPYLPWQRRKS